MENRYTKPDLWEEPKTPDKRPHYTGLTIGILFGTIVYGLSDSGILGFCVGGCLYIIVRGMLE